MKITIEVESKEIANLVLALQGQHGTKEIVKNWLGRDIVVRRPEKEETNAKPESLGIALGKFYKACKEAQQIMKEANESGAGTTDDEKEKKNGRGNAKDTCEQYQKGKTGEES